MNGLPDARVGSAAADIAAHRLINILVGWFWNLGQQHRRAHNLPGLAIAALRHVQLNPRLLQGMRQVSGQPLDCRYVLSLRSGQRSNTRANRLSCQVYGARSAERHSTAEFCSRQSQRVPQHPQQRSRWIDVHVDSFPVYGETGHTLLLLHYGEMATLVSLGWWNADQG